MEEQLRAEKERLRESKLLKEAADANKALVEEKMSLEVQVKRMMDQAQKSCTRFRLLRNLQKWRPRRNAGMVYQVAIEGPCPKACLMLTFDVLLDRKVVCHAEVDTTLFDRSKGYKIRKQLVSLLPFIEYRYGELCQQVTNVVLNNPKEIKKFMRKIVWQASRLQRQIVEMAALKKRFQAVLCQTDDKSNFYLEVEFRNAADEPRLMGTFEMGYGYPYAPINVQFDLLNDDDSSEKPSMFSVDEIQRKLIQSAQPGFGSLTRTIDIITAYVKL